MSNPVKVTHLSTLLLHLVTNHLDAILDSIPPYEMFEATGRLVYDPQTNRTVKKEDWWCIMLVSNDLIKYYQFHIAKLFEPYVALTFEDTVWRAHASVVKGETPGNPTCWKRYQDHRVKFKYDFYIYRVKEFFCIDIVCPFLEKLRSELGLSKGLKNNKPFHITIGRVTKSVYLKHEKELTKICADIGMPMYSAHPSNSNSFITTKNVQHYRTNYRSGKRRSS